jgi:putative transposase
MRRRFHVGLDGRRLALCCCGVGRFLAQCCGLVNEDAAQAVIDALVMVVCCRGKPDALRHRSDRGSQYTSDQFHRLLLELGVTCSSSRVGTVWNNSPMESFFSSLKAERTACNVYRARDDARADVFDYIERVYSPT